MEWAVEVRNITKIYLPSPKWMGVLLRSAITSPVTALDNISLTVEPGELCAIVGPNGAGKSTLFRILTGLTTATSGTTRICGTDVETAPRSARGQLGFMPAGDQTLQLRLSCVENLLFHGQLAGLSGRVLRRRTYEVLDLVGLAHVPHRVGFALSAGMRARLQLARALLHHPHVLVLDEPTAAVDPVGSYELLQLIMQIAADEGVAVLLSSHRLEEIEALRKRIVLMDRGAIIYDGPLEGLPLPQARKTVRLRFATPADCAAVSIQLSATTGFEVVQDMNLPPTELAVAGNASIGSLITSLGSMVERLNAVEEMRPPLRDVIYGILQAPPQQDPEGAFVS